MPNVLFSSTALGLLNRTLDLTSGSFYAHLVTAVPTRSITTVAGLSLATGGNYSSQAVALSAAAANGTGAIITTATAPTWSSLTTDGTSVVGVVFCKQTGASPATTDPVISFLQYAVPNSVTLSTTANSPIVTASSGLSAFSSALAIADNSSNTVIPLGSRILFGQSDTSMILTNAALLTNASLPATIYTYTAYTPKLSNGDDFAFNIPSTGIIRLD